MPDAPTRDHAREHLGHDPLLDAARVGLRSFPMRLLSRSLYPVPRPPVVASDERSLFPEPSGVWPDPFASHRILSANDKMSAPLLQSSWQQLQRSDLAK